MYWQEATRSFVCWITDLQLQIISWDPLFTFVTDRCNCWQITISWRWRNQTGELDKSWGHRSASRQSDFLVIPPEELCWWIFNSVGLIAPLEMTLIVQPIGRILDHVKNYKIKTGKAPIYEKSLGRNITINIIIPSRLEQYRYQYY